MIIPRCAEVRPLVRVQKRWGQTEGAESGHTTSCLSEICEKVSMPCRIRFEEMLTVNDNNATMTKSLLVNDLCFNEGLIEECTHCSSPVKADDTIIALHLFQGANHGCLIPCYVA